MASIVAIQVSVARAFCHSGGLKAGTPSEMASVPVRAAQPEANARNTRKAVSDSVGGGVGEATDVRSPRARRTAPTANMKNMPPMNRYVGAARMVPDSRTPRRLMTVIKPMKPRAS